MEFLNEQELVRWFDVCNDEASIVVRRVVGSLSCGLYRLEVRKRVRVSARTRKILISSY